MIHDLSPNLATACCTKLETRPCEKDTIPLWHGFLCDNGIWQGFNVKYQWHLSFLVCCPETEARLLNSEDLSRIKSLYMRNCLVLYFRASKTLDSSLVDLTSLNSFVYSPPPPTNWKWKWFRELSDVTLTSAPAGNRTESNRLGHTGQKQST